MSQGRLRLTDLFVGGTEGYHTHRIPAMTVTTKGTILAFCEGRKYTGSDTGKIDIILKRSFDNGDTWAETQVVVAEGEDMTCGNPCPVVDRKDGAIWLPFCKNRADGPEELIVEGKAPRTVWITRSSDDGATWSDPIEITGDVKKPEWTWYATGPCHGIQLKNHRLLIPCDHQVGVNFNSSDPYHAHVIYSDDHGASWRIGGISDEGMNECAAVETDDGAIYLNCRNYRRHRRRAYAWSRDHGDSFLETGWDDALFEPICQGSLVRYTDRESDDKNRVLFSNPASIQETAAAESALSDEVRLTKSPRTNLRVRVSYDECRKWTASRLLNGGPSAYSDLAIASDMTICCLYERGAIKPYDKITFAQFDLEWLTRGADRLPE